jgi:hypothetical protein
MPIRAQITKEAIEGSGEVKVHFIPASIDGNGAIKIDEYFNSYMDSDVNGGEISNIYARLLFHIA